MSLLKQSIAKTNVGNMLKFEVGKLVLLILMCVLQSVNIFTDKDGSKDPEMGKVQ